jgi:hypothetical protein
VYKERENYYAKDKKGNIICMNSQTSCIQEAVDSLTPNRSWIETVFISSGIYEIYDTIKLDSYTRLVAHGAYLKLGDRVNKPMITNRDQTRGNIRITIEGGIYDGNRDNNPDMPNALIHFIKGNEYVVKDTIIRRSSKYALRYDNGGTMRAFRNYFRENFAGVALTGWDHLFMHNYYSENEYADLFLAAAGSSFVGEYFGSYASSNIEIIGYGKFSIFVGCVISDASKNNILMYKVGDTLPINNVFVGNRIAQFLEKQDDNTYDLILIRDGYNNVFIGNLIESYTQQRKPKYLIEELSGASSTFFIENILAGRYGTAPVSLSGTNSVYKFRGLITTENSGVATLPAGSTRITVNHNMGIRPNKILLTPGANIRIWYENVTNTSFDIVTDTPQTSDIYISWMAKL